VLLCAGASDEQHSEAKDKLGADKAPEVLPPTTLRQYNMHFQKCSIIIIIFLYAR